MTTVTYEPRLDRRGSKRGSDVRLPTDPVDVAWACGIVEGEGCFSNEKRGYENPLIQVSMTDEDIIRRLQSIFGGTVNGPYKPQSLGHKLKWVWGLRGTEHVRNVVVLFWPHLGHRRKQQAMQMLHNHRIATSRRQSKPKYPRTCKRGHVIASAEGDLILKRQRTCRACVEANS